FDDGSSSYEIAPTHVFEWPGTYLVRVYVKDEWEQPAVDTLLIEVLPAGNNPPVADAGGDQTVHPGTVVTLDASGSSDPDQDYPLTYLWQMTSMPTGSTAGLSDPALLDPTFTADMPGDYIIELVVTDSRGLASVPDDVWVSTFNTAPVADAGADQAIIAIGTTVQLGGDSYDLDGDPLDYLWTIMAQPLGSLAALDDDDSATPAFVADVHGDYVIELMVADPWIWSEPDTVTVSLDNVKPVAEAGGNQAVYQGDTVYLDGSGSDDANGDELTYNWSFVSVPGGSGAVLADADTVGPSFVADEAGTYVVSLVVNDGQIDSDADNVTITATATQDLITDTLGETVDVINQLDPDVLRNANLAGALTNKINA
ncbi:unnamed protein product, partial [marine sediment metagenome]